MLSTVKVPSDPAQVIVNHASFRVQLATPVVRHGMRADSARHPGVGAPRRRPPVVWSGRTEPGDPTAGRLLQAVRNSGADIGLGEDGEAATRVLPRIPGDGPTRPRVPGAPTDAGMLRGVPPARPTSDPAAGRDATGLRGPGLDPVDPVESIDGVGPFDGRPRRPAAGPHGPVRPPGPRSHRPGRLDGAGEDFDFDALFAEEPRVGPGGPSGGVPRPVRPDAYGRPADPVRDTHPGRRLDDLEDFSGLEPLEDFDTFDGLDGFDDLEELRAGRVAGDHDDTRVLRAGRVARDHDDEADEAGEDEHADDETTAGPRGQRARHRTSAGSMRHAYYPGHRMNLGVVLLPLRVFLGFISVYAGMGKLCDPVYFDGGEDGTLVGWLTDLRPWGLASPLHDFALGHPVGAGLTVAFLQIIVGVLTMLGLWQRVAASLGVLLSAALLVTVSWHTAPAYELPDIVYLAAWSPLVIAGAPVYSLDGRLVADAWRRLGPRSDIWDLRKRVLRRGSVLVAVVVGLALLTGSMVGGAVRSATTVTVPEPGGTPRNHLPGSPLPQEPSSGPSSAVPGTGGAGPSARPSSPAPSSPAGPERQRTGTPGTGAGQGGQPTPGQPVPPPPSSGSTGGGSATGGSSEGGTSGGSGGGGSSSGGSDGEGALGGLLG